MTTQDQLIDEKIRGFNKYQRFGYTLKLIELMLPLWDQYAAEKYSLYYIDSIVGMHHKVKADLINRTFEIGKKSLMEDVKIPELIALSDDYGDPIVAIQDMDWELPRELEWLFHASYNLMRYMTQAGPEPQEEITYNMINQAINAVIQAGILNEVQIVALLE